MDHDRGLLHVIRVGVLELEALRQLEVELDGRTLPRATQAIAQEAGAMLQVCFCGPATLVRARKKKMARTSRCTLLKRLKKVFKYVNFRIVPITTLFGCCLKF